MNTLAKTFLVVSALAPLLFLAPSARADEKEACVAASDQAQTLRDEGKLRRAREALLTCAREACPGIVRKDCEKWLGEVDASQPTVVIAARDAKGHDIVTVRVMVDGAPLLDHLDGKPAQVDPGDHVFRYESPGLAAHEEHVVVRVGEKNRPLTVQLRPPAGDASVTPSTPSTAPEPAPEQKTEGAPVLAYTLGVVGIAALGSFAYFGITGRSDVSDLRATCAPNCAQKDVDAAKTKLLVADVSLGVGVVTLGTAAYLLLTHSSSTATGSGAAHVDLRPLPGGAAATFGGVF